MNKGLYKGDGHIYWYKTWKNSSENSGASISLDNNRVMFENYEWTDFYRPDKKVLGATCLAQWE